MKFGISKTVKEKIDWKIPESTRCNESKEKKTTQNRMHNTNFKYIRKFTYMAPSISIM